jgi:hypothetical protein
MASPGERGFRDILAASCLSPCAVPFSCLPQTFENLDGSHISFEIVDGICRTKAASADPAEVPSVECDRQISVEDDSVEDSAFGEDLSAIFEYFNENLGRLFNSQVTSLHLVFGVIEDGHKIYLLDGDGATAVNGFTLNLFSEIPGGEQALTEFITGQLSCDWNAGRQCVTNSPKCTPAGYQCPRLFVVLYRAHARFPSVNEARLYRLLKSRFHTIDPEFSRELANVCIGCLHIYTAEQRIYQAQKATNQLPTTMDPPLFEALVPAELAVKGKSDVGLTPKGYAAYSYWINIRRSPYRTSPVPNLTPSIRTSLTPVRPIPKSEKWVDRLYHAAITPAMESRDDSDKEPFQAAVFSGPKPWMRPTNVSYSQRLTPKVYTNQPFTYEFLERVRERANRNVERSQKLRNDKRKV